MPDLIDYHLGRLKDKRPEVRIKAAEELALLGDPVALPALEALFRTETDAAVKRAAQEAGRVLYAKQKETQDRDQEAV